MSAGGCGRFPGYEQFLVALADPGDLQYEEYKIWSEETSILVFST